MSSNSSSSASSNSASSNSASSNSASSNSGRSESSSEPRVVPPRAVAPLLMYKSSEDEMEVDRVKFTSPPPKKMRLSKTEKADVEEINRTNDDLGITSGAKKKSLLQLVSGRDERIVVVTAWLDTKEIKKPTLESVEIGKDATLLISDFQTFLATNKTEAPYARYAMGVFSKSELPTITPSMHGGTRVIDRINLCIRWCREICLIDPFGDWSLRSICNHAELSKCNMKVSLNENASVLMRIVVRNMFFGFTDNNNVYAESSLLLDCQEVDDELTVSAIRPLLTFIYKHLNPRQLGNPFGTKGAESIKKILTTKYGCANTLQKKALSSGVWSKNYVAGVLKGTVKTDKVVAADMVKGVYFPIYRMLVKLMVGCECNEDKMWITKEEKELLENEDDTIDEAGFCRDMTTKTPEQDSDDEA